MRRLASVYLVAALSSPKAAHALGLGELTLDSFLNEPLRAEVALLELGDLDPSQVKIRLATREDFTRAGVEREYFLTSLRFSVTAEDGGTLVITSSEPVREPYLNFIVEARWPSGRLLREYTVLLDPPVFVGSERGITARASTAVGNTSRRDEPSRSEQPSRSTTADSGRSTPDRSFGAGSTDAPTSGERYLVKRDDTLWRIAEAGKPAGASVQQTMLDIQRLNPDAFIGGNINRLKAGYVLRLPTAEQITQQSIERAIAEVAVQEERWQRGASDVESRFDASESLDYAGDSGAARGDGHLQIAAGDEPAGVGDSGLSARMEDLDRSQRENTELSTRLNALEQQIQMQERLISLKDDQIAALQGALGRAGADAPEMPEAAVEGAVEGAVDTTAPGAGDPTASEDPVLEMIPDAGDTAAEEEAPAQPAVTPPAPAPRPAPEPSLIDMLMDQILYIGAGLLVLLLALGYFLRSRLPGMKRGGDQPMPQRGSSDTEDEFADVRLSEDSLIVDEFADDVEAAPEAAENISSFSAPDEEAYAAQFESGDALAEADIYIAYGRFPQAVDLLKTAINVEPVNTDYRMKLMEACVEMVDREEFQQQYADLQVIGDENVLTRARSLLDAVDGGEIWLEDLPAPTLTSDAVAAAQSTAAPVEKVEGSDEVDLGLDDDSMGDDTELGGGEELDLDLDLEEPESDSDMLEPIEYERDSDTVEAAAAKVAGDSLDAGLEEELLEEPGDVEAAMAPDLLDADDMADLGLDDDDAGDDDLLADLSDESDDFESLQDEELSDSLVFEEPEDDAGDSGDELLTDLDDLDLGLGEEEPADTTEEQAGSDVEDLEMSFDDADGDDLMDLASELGTEDDADTDELDLGSFDDIDLGDETEAVEAESEAESESEEASDDSFDLDDVSELDSSLDGEDISLDDDGADVDLENMELDMSAEDSEDDSGLMFAADGDEVATKLDLARAYIDMGDHDGARTILSEVIEEGNEGQQSEAKSLLEGID